MRITVTLIRQVRDDIDNALTVIGKKHGLGFSLDNISYDDKSFRGKFSCLVLDEKVKSIEEQEFIQFVESIQNTYDLKRKHYKTQFSWNGKDFRLIGIRLNRQKYPVLAEQVKDGVMYKLQLKALERIVK